MPHTLSKDVSVPLRSLSDQSTSTAWNSCGRAVWLGTVSSAWKWGCPPLLLLDSFGATCWWWFGIFQYRRLLKDDMCSGRWCWLKSCQVVLEITVGSCVLCPTMCAVWGKTAQFALNLSSVCLDTLIDPPPHKKNPIIFEQKSNNPPIIDRFGKMMPHFDLMCVQDTLLFNRLWLGKNW